MDEQRDEQVDEQRDEQATMPAVASATVLVVRDGDAGLEVLLLERHLRSDFAGGAYVFPGGKVDPRDGDLAADRHTGVDLEVAARELQVDGPDVALGLLVAAVRETFEEAGVLLAHRADGTPVSASDLASASFREARRALAARGEPYDWRPWLADEDLVLDLGGLAFWSWWLTPHGMHKRFDTRFFVAALPAAQADVAAHDEVETTAMRWLTPRAALDAQAAGEVTIIFPTRRNLQALEAYTVAADAVAAAAAGRTDRRPILPTLVLDGDVPMVQHPYEDAPEAV
ncbi:NUDIX hydrolase [Nitriliruptoraceae bacterium ZYF776]|nr:NUDIX hydrolase [Profundirhabdus halotolerans]